jgi:hypothetical protein
VLSACSACCACSVFLRALCDAGRCGGSGLPRTAANVQLCKSSCEGRWDHNGHDAGPAGHEQHSRLAGPGSSKGHPRRFWFEGPPSASGGAREGWLLLHATGSTSPSASTRTSRRSLRLCCELLHPPSAAAAVSAPSLLLPRKSPEICDLRHHTTPPPTQPPDRLCRRRRRQRSVCRVRRTYKTRTLA